MLGILLAILILLWIVGYIQIPFFQIPTFPLLSIYGHPITLWNILVFLLVVWIISILPRPFRVIAGIIFILWIVSLFGFPLIISFGGWFLLALIVLLIISLVF